MDVLYTCDDNYIWIMGISVISLFKNNRDIQNLNVFLLGENISDDNEQILYDIGKKYNRRIVIIDVPKLDIPESLVSVRWPLSAFTRLFSGQLLPQNMHRVLYLDCDTIIKGSIADLEKVDLTTFVCAGVKDCIGKVYKNNIGLANEEVYVNAGVVLFNLDELREIDIKKAIDFYMKRYLKLINYADQDILNGIFKGKIKVLRQEYNVMTIAAVHAYNEIIRLRKPTNYYKKSEWENSVETPVIIHYTTNMMVVRPWFSNTNHPFANEFKKYMSMSPWKNNRLNLMVFTAKEYKVIGIIEKLPKSVANEILGFFHSELKPRYIRMKAGYMK